MFIRSRNAKSMDNSYTRKKNKKNCANYLELNKINGKSITVTQIQKRRENFFPPRKSREL